MDLTKMKKEVARNRRLFEARYNKSFNVVSDWSKGQNPIFLIDPPKELGAMICQNCGRIVSATLPHQCNCDN
jgi:hypothetical protein